MRVVRRESYRSMPWKNGMGRTEEILVEPEGAGMEDFVVRLSIAHVGNDGPFSLFPGVDRSILVLEGKGMWLDIDGGASLCLTPDSAPFAFSGDLRLASRNIAGPTLDLNAMTRGGSHRMARTILAGSSTYTAATMAFLLPRARLQVQSSAGGFSLSALDCLQLHAGETVGFTCDPPVELVVITFEQNDL